MDKNIKEMCEYILFTIDPKKIRHAALSAFDRNVYLMATDILSGNQVVANPTESVDYSKLVSPISIEGEPINCVELTIYDNDGPEGYYKRLRFSRSVEAVDCINKFFAKDMFARDLNFEIVNYWK